jgi:hypothetical protein
MVKPIDLMIIGTQKAGTTSLLRYLSQHPQICVRPHNEIIFFRNDEMYERGYSYAWEKYFNKCSVNKAIVAKDVMAMYSEKALKRIKEHNPQMILVILLRNPVARAYSAYWYVRRQGWEPIKSFEAALEAEKYRLKEGWTKWYRNAYIYNSIYYPHIKTIFDNFDKICIKIYLSEWLKTDPIKICKDIYSILQLNENFTPDTSVNYNKQALPRSDILGRIINFLFTKGKPISAVIKNILTEEKIIGLRHFIWKLNTREGKIPLMNPHTKKWLLEYIRPYNLSLQELTGIDVSHWDNE